MKILIVDDDSLFLELAANMLKSLGYRQLHSALSAEDALVQIDKAAPAFDCFLLDIQMPGMDGIELCRRIRSCEAYRHTPIVMLTAMTEKHYIDGAFQAGASDYITKPVERIEVKARMRNVEALLSERNHTGLVSQQLRNAEISFGRAVRFEDPVLLNDASWVLPFSSLENYLLRLGNMRLFNTTAYGFHIENAADIHAQASGLEFIDMLTDVSRAIRDALGSFPSFLSYAGYGDFCAVVPKLARFDRSFLQLQINDALELAADMSEEQSWPVPKVRMGAGQGSKLLSFRDPTEMLHGAITKARRGGEREFEGFTRWHMKVADEHR